jgi:hypothetical protein
MTQRRLLFCALFLAAWVQITFVVTYAITTAGCFCAITGVGQPVPSDALAWIVLAGSLPLRTLPVQLPFSVGGWGTALLFAALNSLFWTGGFWTLMNLVAVFERVRLRRSASWLRAFHLLPLASVQLGGLAIRLLLLLGLGLGVGAAHRQSWLSEAQHRVAATVEAARHGQNLPYSGYGIDCYPGDCPSLALAGDYVLERQENYTVRLAVLEPFAPPRSWGGEARFQDGTRYWLEAFKLDQQWEVFMSLVRH